MTSAWILKAKAANLPDIAQAMVAMLWSMVKSVNTLVTTRTTSLVKVAAILLPPELPEF